MSEKNKINEEKISEYSPELSHEHIAQQGWVGTGGDAVWIGPNPQPEPEAQRKLAEAAAYWTTTFQCLESWEDRERLARENLFRACRRFLGQPEK